MKLILITTYRRPDYTQQVLDALSQCYGIEDYTVVISQDFEPRIQDSRIACQETARVVGEWKAPCKVIMETHTPPLLIDRHKMYLITKYSTMSDFFIFMEDDMLAAKDFLRYMEWASGEFKDDQEIMSICGYARLRSRIELVTNWATSRYDTYADCGFMTWGWGSWTDKWHKIWNDQTYIQWCHDVHGSRYDLTTDVGRQSFERLEINGRFDWYLNTNIFPKNNWLTVHPVVPRIYNIGREQGEHAVPEEYDREAANPFGAWEIQNLDDPLPRQWQLRKRMPEHRWRG
jgi:hypothetical protein